MIWRVVARRRWAATSNNAWTAATNASPTIRVATATVRSARPWHGPAGSPRRRAFAAGRVLPRRVHPAGRVVRPGAGQPVALYDLLFQAAAATIREVAANPKRLGAQLGVLLVLHTWGQTLQHHPHVHGVVTGGGLSCNAGAWLMRIRGGWRVGRASSCRCAC